MSALGTSFSSQGATPQSKYPFSPTSFGSTPQSKALNNMTHNTSTPALPSNLISAPQASTALKKQTVITPTGHTVTSEYHAPEPTGTNPGLVTKNQTNQTPPTQSTEVGSMGYDIQNGLNPGTSSQAGYTAPAPTTYPGLINSLANQGNSTYNTATGKYIGLLADSAARNTDLGTQAQSIASQAGNKISDLGGQGARGELGFLTTGTSPVAQGNAAITAQTTAAQQQAVSQGANVALQGNQQALAANGQQQTGYNEAAGASQGQQNANQSALGTAAGLSAPVQISPSTTLTSPTTGAPIAGLMAPNSSGNTALNNAVSTYAQKVSSGQMSYADAVSALNAYGPQGQQALTQALGSGFNVNQNQGLSSAQSNNAATTGTAITGANATGLAQSIQAENELNTAASNALALSSQVKTALQNSGLSLTNSTDANTIINKLSSRLGSTGYTQLVAAVNEAKNAYSAILAGTGSTPSEAGSQADANINVNMTPQQILTAIDQLNKGVYARQQSAHQQTQNYQNSLSSSSPSNSSSISGGGLYSF